LLRKIVSLKLFFQFALAKPLDFQNDALEISRRFFCFELLPVDFIRRRDHLPPSLASSGWDVDTLKYPASSLLQ
jgi:hypothetical protein